MRTSAESATAAVTFLHAGGAVWEDRAEALRCCSHARFLSTSDHSMVASCSFTFPPFPPLLWWCGRLCVLFKPTDLCLDENLFYPVISCTFKDCKATERCVWCLIMMVSFSVGAVVNLPSVVSRVLLTPYLPRVSVLRSHSSQQLRFHSDCCVSGASQQRRDTLQA